jgi:hypothetical protein
LIHRGYKVAISEPYTITLTRGVIVDLYTNPSFTWVVYMDGGKLIRDYAKNIEPSNITARLLAGRPRRLSLLLAQCTKSTWSYSQTD